MIAEKKHKTILVVEDSPTRVLTAGNGKLGVEMAYLHKPDVVVLDLEMPGMNGFEASSLISGDYRTEHTAIIILTSHNTKNEAVKSRLLGAVKFIHKDDLAYQTLLEELKRLRILEAPLETRIR
jgi:CheY-like chemotaxis protein